jgi:hypothetical protein
MPGKAWSTVSLPTHRMSTLASRGLIFVTCRAPLELVPQCTAAPKSIAEAAGATCAHKDELRRLLLWARGHSDLAATCEWQPPASAWLAHLANHDGADGWGPGVGALAHNLNGGPLHASQQGTLATEVGHGGGYPGR